MTLPPTPHRLRWLILAVAAFLLSACAAQRIHKEGMELIAAGNYEDGLARLEAAVREDPRDATYRMSVVTTRDSITLRLLEAADRANSDGRIKDAETGYRRVLGIDPKNQRAIDGLRATEEQKNIEGFIKEGQASLKKGDLDSAQKAADAALALNGRHPGAKAFRKQVDDVKLKELPLAPQLKSKFAKPVSLEFRDANLKMVFDVLSRTSGINFVFDKEVKADIKVTIFVRQVAVEDAIDLLLLQSQLEKKVINDSSVLIFPSTPQKLKEFQDLTVKSFYLTNADAKQTLNMIKTILKTKDVFIDEKLNLLVMRDTPDAIRLAEKLIASQDLAEPEVVLEIEVLELNRTKLLDLGIQWPSVLTSPFDDTPVLRDGTGTSDTNPPIFDTPVNDLRNLKNNLAISGFTVDRRVAIRLANTDSDSRQLASPRIRVRSKEKAKIHIGTKEPVVTATIAATAGTTPITTDNIQYLDTGIKLEVEPTVYLNDEVAIKLNVDVSSATQLTATRNGSIPVRVSTRNAATLLRLKDGETQALAGLLQSNKSLSRDQIPGLGEIPVFGTLFGTNRHDNVETELVILITPHIVRNLQRADVGLAETYSGSEATLRSRQYLSRPIGEGDATPLKGVGVDTRTSAPSIIPPRSASAAPTPASSALGVTWENPGELKVGQETTILLSVKATQPLVSTALQIGYDPAVLKVVEVTDGDLMNREGVQASFSTRDDDKAGRLFIGVSRPGGSSITGDGVLLRLKVSPIVESDGTQLKMFVFSGIGPNNRLLPTPVPAPLELKVGPGS